MIIKINNGFLFLIIILIFFIKIILFIAIKNSFLSISLGGGNDADYYDAFAIGLESFEVNIWPVILRYMNNFGLYSREVIPYIFLLLNLYVIPIFMASLANIKFNKEQKYYLYIVLLCLIYPTLYFFTFDIYRDIFMIFIFLIGCIVVKNCLNSSNFLAFIFLFFVALMIGYFLYVLRPYLGLAFISALFLWNIIFTKKRLLFLTFFYLLVLFFANYIGLFESITEYRAGFEENEAGSTLGLDFSNPVMFIPNFIISVMGQLFGLFFVNAIAVIIFLIETVPFLFMLVYVIKNIKFSDKFLRFLIIFFVIYASIWLIGNDNLGTAVRLRIYNYLAIYICFFSILKFKRETLKLQ